MFFKRILSRVLRSPELVWVSLLALAALGAFTFRGLKADLFPPLNFPILNVITESPNLSSLEVERQITLPIESASGGVLGVTRVRSTSATGISMVSAEFQWGTDMLNARQLLIQALGNVRGQLPGGAEPTIENLSASLALIEGYSFQGGEDLVKLRDLALYDLKPRLQRIPGVYKVVVMGGRVLEYAIYPNPLLLIKYDMTLTDLKDALVNNNILASPGVVNHHSQEFVLHANGQFADAREIAGTVVAVKSGQPIHVGDVARVTESFQYERGDTSEKGSPSVLISIYKQPDFDTGGVADAVATEVESFRKSLPGQYTLRNYYDQAELVRNSIGSVKESVWIGAVLVILILAAFLHNWRSTLIAAVSIPVSVVAALVVMRIVGIGLNIMSLGGLAIGTGIIVDDAIVVLENVFRWISERPQGHGSSLSDDELILESTHEVVRPVVVSTLTNIGIFLPMVLIEGFAGRLFQPVSLTVTFALLASLVAALTLIPLLAKKWLMAPGRAPAHEDHANSRLHRMYAPTLEIALGHPRKAIAIALIAVVLSGFVFRRLDVEFLPELDEGAVLLQTSLPPGASLEESRRIGKAIESWAAQAPGVITVTRRTGHAPGAEDTDSVNHSDITVKLVPKPDRPLSIRKWIEGMREQTAKLPSAQVNYLMPLADKINDALGGVPADIGVDLYGPDLGQLHDVSEKLMERMKKISGISELRPPEDIPVPSLEIQIDRKEAGRLGISESTIFDTLQSYSVGLQVTNVRQLQKELAVTIRFARPEADLRREALLSLPLRTSSGNVVPLEQVAHLTFGSIPSQVLHEHLSRKLVITANIQGRNAKDVARDITQAISDLKLPLGYSWDFSGKFKTQEQALGNLEYVLMLAILVVAVILWLEFRSIAQTLLILLTIPLAGVGAFISLWLTHETLNVSSMIGAVMLVGIVVRNGIMLMDYINIGRASGQSLPEAVRSAAEKRVRPILMTASVTTLGLAPLAVGWGTGAELQRPLAIAVIGGLLTSTGLTLLILPSATLLAGRWLNRAKAH